MSTPGVQWPGKAYASDATDLSAPIKQLLQELKLLESPSPGEKVTVARTPESLQLITAGATTISKLVTTLIISVGGLSALATGLGGFFGKVGGSNLDTPLTRTAFILGGSVLGSAVMIGLAMVVRSDVSARADASAAQFTARSTVAAALMKSFVPPSPSPVHFTPYAIKCKDGSWHSAEELVWRSDGLAAKVDGDVKPITEWETIVRVDQLSPTSPLRTL